MFRGGPFNELFYGLMGVAWMFYLLAPAFLLSFLVMYIVGVVQARQEGRREPMLGAKVFLTFLMSLSFQLILAGVAVLLGMFFDEGDYGEAFKDAGGLILGGALAGAYPTFVYFARVRLYGSNRVLRQALGFNAIVTGIVFTVAVTSTMVMWLQEGESLEYPIAFTFVYFFGNLACAVPVLAQPREELYAEE